MASKKCCTGKKNPIAKKSVQENIGAVRLKMYSLSSDKRARPAINTEVHSPY